MYQTILLAYDGSRDGRAALQQGAELAGSFKAKVWLLAVVAPQHGVALAEAASPSDVPQRECDRIVHDLQAGAEMLRADGLKVETRLASGTPAAEIGRVAREIDADLIVVGHRPLTAVARWWSGSTGTSLLAHAPCSLLVALPAHDDEGHVTA